MMESTIMVKLSVDSGSEFMGIKTYDRVHGSHGRFLIARNTLSQILDRPGGATHCDSDCGHYAEIQRIGDHLWFRIAWLSLYSDWSIKGFQQIFAVPMKTIKPLLTSVGNAKVLYTPAHAPATIKTSLLAAEIIRKFVHNKHIRRAFSKAMRDCFNWPGDLVMLHRDGEYSFYFTTRSGIPRCGGLILHEGKKNGYPYIYYSVHT